MNMYLTHNTGYGWDTVECGPDSTSAGVKQAALEFIRGVDAEQIAAVIVVSSSVRVGAGKPIQFSWLTDHNMLAESRDQQILDDVKEAFESQGDDAYSRQDCS